MNKPRQHEDDDVEYVPIPLDRATRERLVQFSRIIGKHPAKAASVLLRDLLIDDEKAHEPEQFYN